ncbi:MAG: PAS domain S-box protein, partial [Verrucomicrobiota bacterium]
MEPTSSENLHIQAIGLSMDICAKIEAGLQVYGARVRVQLHDNWAVAEETAAAQEKVVDLILIHESRAVPCWNDIQAWNEQRSNTPFIVLSEAPDVERIQAAHKSGAADYVEIDSEGRYLVYLPHRILHFIQHRRTLDAHRTAERAVERIATSISASTGRAFFRELTNHITETLGVMYAVVGELKDAESARIRTLSVSRHGKRERNFEYPTVGTPFAVLLDSQHALCTENAQECYPNDSKLKKLGAESYIGVPLLDAKRKVIGMLSVVDNKPIKEPDFLLSALTIFATRTQLELERQRAEILLKGQARILDQLGEAIIGADINGTIKSWNQQAVQLFGRSAQQAIGSSLSSILPHTDEAAARAQLLEPLLIHGNHHVEIPLKRHDGDIFESHLSLSQEKNSQGEVVGVIACCRDISVRMRTERQRREAQQRLAFHVERTPLAFLEWD